MAVGGKLFQLSDRVCLGEQNGKKWMEVGSRVDEREALWAHPLFA
jgi:hypothetical protein